MNFTDAISTCLSKYFDFEGRASRSEFWWFTLFGMLLSWAASIVGIIASGSAALGYVVTIALFFPQLSVSIRRLHDIDRSGWWYLLVFTGIGAIVLLVWFASEGASRGNSYGKVFGSNSNESEVPGLLNTQIFKSDVDSTEKSEFIKDEDRKLSNDAYQIYLVKKYSISKNEVLGKFVLGSKLYENLNDVLLAAMYEDQKKYKVKEVNSSVALSINKVINIEEALNLLLSLGYQITTKKRSNDSASSAVESYEVLKDGTTHIKYSDEALINFANMVA